MPSSSKEGLLPSLRTQNFESNTVTRDQLRLKIIGHNVMEEKTPILRGKPLVVFELPSRPPQNRLEADGNCTKTCEGITLGIIGRIKKFLKENLTPNEL